MNTLEIEEVPWSKSILLWEVFYLAGVLRNEQSFGLLLSKKTSMWIWKSCVNWKENWINLYLPFNSKTRNSIWHWYNYSQKYCSCKLKALDIKKEHHWQSKIESIDFPKKIPNSLSFPISPQYSLLSLKNH